MSKLNIILRLNAASCIFFGSTFVLQPEKISRFLGAFPEHLLMVLGTLLLVNGIHLISASVRTKRNWFEILYFSVGDFLWVSLTLSLLFLDIYIKSAMGAAAALIVGSMVGLFGILQLLAIPEGQFVTGTLKAENADDHLPYTLSSWSAICASWLAMKAWVKVWLIILNLIFLAAGAFWPEPLAKVILTGYLASGPFLLIIVIQQRGLTRLLGIAHLIPWLPLLAYLLLRLTSDLAGPQIQWHSTPPLFHYMALLLTALLFCLILDIIDVIRWFQGHTYRMGSVHATLKKASSRHKF